MHALLHLQFSITTHRHVPPDSLKDFQQNFCSSNHGIVHINAVRGASSRFDPA
jgi:hypothetical protein